MTMQLGGRRAAAVALTTIALAGTGLATAGSAQAAVQRDSCLTGTWKAGKAQANRILTQLAGNTPGLKVTGGSFEVTFRNGKVTSEAKNITIEGNFDGQDVAASASSVSTFPYRTRGGKIVAGRGTSTLTYGKMSAKVGGVSIDLPTPAPETTTVEPSSRAYTCTQRKLTMTVPVPSGGTVTVTANRA